MRSRRDLHRRCRVVPGDSDPADRRAYSASSAATAKHGSSFRKKCRECFDPEQISVRYRRPCVPPRLRRMLYRAVYFKSDSGDAERQALGRTLRATRRRSALRDLRPTGATRMLFGPAAATRDVWRKPRRSAGMADRTRNADATGGGTLKRLASANAPHNEIERRQRKRPQYSATQRAKTAVQSKTKHCIAAPANPPPESQSNLFHPACFASTIQVGQPDAGRSNRSRGDSV